MSGKVVVYIASTLDGYIATAEGGIDWLTSYEVGNYGYEELMARTGALVMGSGTYEFFDHDADWPYPDQPTWVFTSREINPFEGADIRVTRDSPSESIKEIKESADGKDVWLVGGGLLMAQFLKERLIDEVIHFVVPKALGEGIPMFTEPVPDPFQVDKVTLGPAGMIELRYRPA